jgi:hypothetical protein
MPKFENTPSKNIIKNILDNLDILAERYRTTKSTDDLIAYIQYRDDVIYLESKLTFLNLYPGYDEKDSTLWNLHLYESVVTDELDIFHNGKSIKSEKAVAEIKEWRKNFGEES